MWQPTEHGFVVAQDKKHSDIESSDIVDFDASFKENPLPDNPLIKFETEEANRIESKDLECNTAT